MPLIPGTADVLTTPLAPTVVQNAQGTGGAISYQIVSVNAAGQDSVPSGATTTSANNASTPNNTISWTLLPGQEQTRILKGGNLLATVGAGVTSYTDSAGSSGVSYTLATFNPAAYVPAANSPIDGSKASYKFSIIGLVPATTPTDIFAISGSTTKTIRVTRLVVSALQTTAGNVDIAVIKRSGGTQSAGTGQAANIVPSDTTNPTATALVQTYTANAASLGTALGNVFAGKLFVPAAATAGSPDKLDLQFGNRPVQAEVLRGATQYLCVNLNSVTLTGGSVDLHCEWSEE